MKPLIIPSRFGEHYQVFAQWQTPVGSGELITTNDAALLFSIITHELIMAAEDWRGVLMRLGVSVPPNFFHAADIYHELVKLFQFRQLQLVKIPRLDRLPVIPTGNGWGYCFTRGPDRHPAGESPVALSSLRDAEIFFQSLKLNEKTLRLFSLKNPRLAGYLVAEQNLAQQLINGLAKQDILAYRVPAPSAAPPVKAVEYIAATAIEREVPLAPEAKDTPPAPSAEAKPQAPAPESAANAKVPPQTLEEASQRLIDAGPAVRAAKANNKPLPPSTYSLADKQAVVEKGLEERFLVRVIETDYAGDSGYIGKVREHGQSISWTAPFSMVEHGDTDAEALLNAFGTRYDPAKKYTVLIIDRDKMNEIGDVQTIIPTKQNLKALIAENPHISTLSPDEVEQVLSDELAPKYYKFAKEKSKQEIKSSDAEGIDALAKRLGFSKEDSQLLIKRQKLADQVAAWEEFTGNGMTLDTNSKGKTYGPVEVVMLDKKPMTLGGLRKDNAIKSIDC